MHLLITKMATALVSIQFVARVKLEQIIERYRLIVLGPLVMMLKL